jgi:ABC-type transporter MlaC component
MGKIILVLLLCLLFFYCIPVYSQSPNEIIQMSNTQVQEILSRHTNIDQETEIVLFKIIDAVTDFDSISHRVIDPFCKNLTEVQCETLNRLFQRLLRVSSIKKMGRHRAERFEYLGEEVTEDTAVVKTLAYYEDDKIRLDYHLERVDGKWLIFNYVVDDVDTIRNYRKQFVRLFARNSFDEILERLENKIAEYEREY